jgi:hypothetical protein
MVVPLFGIPTATLQKEIRAFENRVQASGQRNPNNNNLPARKPSCPETCKCGPDCSCAHPCRCG